MDEALDLAAIEVHPSIEASCPPARVFDLADVGETAAVGTTSFVIGFPHDISRILEDGGRVVFIHTEWSPVEAPPKQLDGFDPAIHFLAKFISSDEYPEADPRGLSGSARWGRRGPTPGVWHPNLELLGVTVTYYPKIHLLKMVRRESVVRFLTTLQWPA